MPNPLYTSLYASRGGIRVFRTIQGMFTGDDDEIALPAGEYNVTDQGRDYGYYHDAAGGDGYYYRIAGSDGRGGWQWQVFLAAYETPEDQRTEHFMEDMDSLGAGALDHRYKPGELVVAKAPIISTHQLRSLQRADYRMGASPGGYSGDS